MDARLYDLRKTTLTMLMASGVDLRTVMSISSHSSPTTLLRHYAHSVEGTQRRALEGLPDTTQAARTGHTEVGRVEPDSP